MTITLHLGVLDFPFTSSSDTSGGVAEILERKYGIMEFFAEQQATFISQTLDKDLSNFLDNMLSGKELKSEPFRGSCQKIEQLFRQALTDEFMNGHSLKGRPVPTRAALDGVSHRFADPYFVTRTNKKTGKVSKVKRNRRPSFIDTGTYRQSFKAWIEI